MKRCISYCLAMVCMTSFFIGQAMKKTSMEQKVRSFEQLKAQETTLRKRAKKQKDVIIDIPHQEWTDKEKERSALHEAKINFDQMMQDLEEATKEMDAFVKSLPAEQKNEFNRVVRLVEKKMQTMDPATLERFLTNRLSKAETDQLWGGIFEGTERTVGPETKEQVVEEKSTKQQGELEEVVIGE